MNHGRIVILSISTLGSSLRHLPHIRGSSDFLFDLGRWKLNLDVVTIGNLPSISRCAVKPVRGQLLGKLDKFPFEECSK